MTQWIKRVGIAAAHGFEYYNIAVYSAIQTYIALLFFPETLFGQNAAIFAWLPFILRFISRPFGGLFIGLYADRYGRKSALVLTSGLTGCATLVMGLLPTYAEVGGLAPILFFIMQLLQAFCFGGENPAAIAYLYESAHKNEHARIGALLWGAPFLSIALSLIVVAITESYLTHAQMLDFGWRIPVLLGVGNIMISYYFRKNLIESKKFVRSTSIAIQKIPTLKIFFLYVPSSILFYGNSISSTILIQKMTSDPSLRVILPILCNVTFFVGSLTLSLWVDRYFNYQKVLKFSYTLVLFGAVPVYALQELHNWYAFALSQLCITFFVACTTSLSPATIFNSTLAKNRISTIGLGINCAIIFVGAFTPMLVSILSQYNQAFVGLMMSIGAISYFIALYLDQYIQPNTSVIKQGSNV